MLPESTQLAWTAVPPNGPNHLGDSFLPSQYATQPDEVDVHCTAGDLLIGDARLLVRHTSTHTYTHRTKNKNNISASLFSAPLFYQISTPAWVPLHHQAAFV